MAILIKRYANRKLYNTRTSRYVTLEDLEKMIRAGREIEVRDAATGEDVTPVVLTQVILQTERGGRVALPAAFLHQLIKHGGAWQEYMARSFDATLGGLVASQRQADQIFRAWAARAGLVPPEPDAPQARKSQKRPRRRAR
ncbi:MAG: polyhydroxyalkanoate synthesis regulator DNA-binding domain-containing protein [Armatimonadota bacterium]